ncbi:O-antigen ligase [Ramlibacter sp. WS9]|uniref:O-antigen ligase family protein n=1 Tax=Ramlibacter sp. WS9 TaxID=1882741 RepID=UPI0011430B0D|nr:O-antigen ligase family protein [Ramlibacter sp. WS9]ROZ68611.1 O-antigen ligase domain-containing protein [Ramlibacter sp. WS9]
MSERFSWESLRPWPAYAVAASVPISLAATNVFKAVLLVFALSLLLGAVAGRRRLEPLQGRRTLVVIALMLGALAMSLGYTSATLSQGAHDWVKYSKLLAIPLLLLVLPTRRHALIALGVYACAQLFVVASSYLLSVNVPLPWVYKTVVERTSEGAVFSSYLDQSIMTVGLGALAWHLRHEIPGRHGTKIGVAIALLCAGNVLFLLPGRSGHVALLAVLTMSLLWALPGRLRPAALAAPLLLVAAMLWLPTEFRDRAAAVVSEAQAYQRGDVKPTSSGLRLTYWRRSVEAFAERPILGHGVGSWNTEFRRLEGTHLRSEVQNLRNPHQEYLMWAVQLGAVGVALFLALLAALAHDASRFTPPVREAAWSLVVIFAAVCMFNSMLYDALIGDYFCILFGLLLAAGSAPQIPQARPA